jgi:biopolymer transport protein ExbB
MKNLKSIILVSLISSSSFASNSLDGLLNKVMADQASQRKVEQEREQNFIQEKNKQKEVLANAQAELKKLEAVTTQLTNAFDNNEKELTILEDKLTQASGTLGEMFGVVKQISGDLNVQLENSVVSAQFKGRDKFVQKLAGRKELPKIDELKRLWHEILTEINESGKVQKFKDSVVQADGSSSEKLITRIGAFNLVSDGVYLNYQPETGQIVELSRQPKGSYLGYIEDLEDSKGNEIVPFALDPSKGVLLGMLVNAPSLMERFHQGGVVGYVIAFLLFIGILIVIERTIFLGKEKKKILAQLNSSEADESNALGRLFNVFKKYQDAEIETLELKLDESIMKSLPPLERGIGVLKILTAIGPLMGLLGTVTGMIATFQSITMFGTGDPKLMAGGISSALVTTVQGLICSIPMLLLHSFISSRSKGIVQILEEQSVGLLAEKAGK